MAATESEVKRSLQDKSKGSKAKKDAKVKKHKKEKKSVKQSKDKSKVKSKVKQVSKAQTVQPAKDTFVRDLEKVLERSLEAELAAVATPQGTLIDSQEIDDENLVGVVPYLKGNWQAEIRKLMKDEDYRHCYIDSNGWHLEFANENCVLNHVPARAQFPLHIYRCPGPAVAFSEKQKDAEQKEEEQKNLQDVKEKEAQKQKEEEQKKLEAIKEKEAQKQKGRRPEET